jgi:hypothetical protein
MEMTMVMLVLLEPRRQIDAILPNPRLGFWSTDHNGNR